MLKNKRKDCHGNKINWLKIKKLKYVKGDPKIYFNYDVPDNFLNFDVRSIIKSRQKSTPQSGSWYSTRKIKQQDKSNPNSVETQTQTPENTLQFPNLRKLYN